MPKKIIHKKESKSDIVHIRIENPSYVRKIILKAAIESTSVIEIAHDLSELRLKKIKLFSELNNNLNNIKLIEKKMSSLLPRLSEENKTKIEPQKHFTEKEDIINDYQDDELSKLRRELANIENRLKDYD